MSGSTNIDGRYGTGSVGFEVHPSVDLDDGVIIGDGSRIWHAAQIRTGATLGRNVVVGRGAYVGPGVSVDANCKIQNHAMIFEPARLEVGVFIGPGAVLTNDRFPRAVNPDGSQKSRDDWEAVGVTIRAGATVGARSVCVAPVTVGRWAMVAAGSVVVADVADFALVAGVPARRIRWVGKAGVPLALVDPVTSTFRCPKTGQCYRQTAAEILEETSCPT